MRFSLIALLLMLTACAEGPVGNAHVPEPAKAVELNRYLGRWYELARYENRFEKGCEAVTADYSLRDDGRIRVLNSCHKGAVDGPLETAEGKAHVVEGSNNAKLRVSFFGPFYGDYWVLDRAEDYSWAIVGEPSGRYLWILTRQPVPSEKHATKLIARAQALGYDTSLLYRPKHVAH
jgi:apolipoprotein D and lipocalin family protein